MSATGRSTGHALRAIAALLAATAAACNSAGSPPSVCGSAAFSFWSPCGFASVSTTCSDAAPTCWTEGTEGFCDIGQVTGDCTVSVVLGDGTKHDFSITLGPSTDPQCNGAYVVTSSAPDFTSATCGADAAADAAATDAAEADAAPAADADAASADGATD